MFKRFFWFCTVTACCVCSAAVLRGVLSLYTTDGVSYSVETDYLDWYTPFPALTVCQQADQDRALNYLVTNNLPTTLKQFAKDLSFWNAKYCRSCAKCTNETCLEDFRDMVEGIRMKCTELLTDCWWNDEHFSCCDRFHPLATESGTCYSFNSRIAGDGNVITVSRYNQLPSLVFTAVDKIEVSVHSPYETINVAQDHVMKRRCFNLPLVSDFEADVKAEETVNDVSVLPLPPESRHCLFRHERPAFAHLWPFEWYSYSACVLYCRAMLHVEVCNCTHHFMPILGDIPQCDVKGLACLFHSKKLSGNDDCNCPMACDEVEYKMTHISCPRFVNEEHLEMLHRGTRGRLRMAQLPTLRVRRHAIRDALGLVVDIGGVIGVFFGASLLSFIEIIYLLFIRKYN